MSNLYFSKNEYLLEKSLEQVLRQVWPSAIITKQFCFSENKKFKYDYAITDGNSGLKILVEFDGDRHYKESAVQRRDRDKAILAKTHGFSLIRWPYWIQPTECTILILMKTSCQTVNSDYPHGFIDKKCVLPADFNFQGIERFLNELKLFPIEVKEQVFKSLGMKLTQKAKEIVLGTENSPLNDLYFASTGVLNGLPLLDANCILDNDKQIRSHLEGRMTESVIMDFILDGVRELADKGGVGTLKLKEFMKSLGLKNTDRNRQFVSLRLNKHWKTEDGEHFLLKNEEDYASNTHSFPDSALISKVKSLLNK